MVIFDITPPHPLQLWRCSFRLSPREEFLPLPASQKGVQDSLLSPHPLAKRNTAPLAPQNPSSKLLKR